MSTKAIARRPASSREDAVDLADAGGSSRRVAVLGTLRRDRVVGRRDGNDPVRRAAARARRRGSRRRSPRIRDRDALHDVVHADEDRREFRREAGQRRQLLVDHVPRREPVDPEVRDELQQRPTIGVASAGDQLVRPALVRPGDGRPDRVRVAERDVPQRPRFGPGGRLRHRDAKNPRASRSKSTGRSSEGRWATSGQTSSRAPATSAATRSAASSVAG